MIIIKIKTDNDAFAEENNSFEVSRILKEIARDYETDTVKSSYNDINGNKVCTVSEL